MKKILTILTVPFRTNGMTNVVRNYYKYINHDIFKNDLLFLNESDECFMKLVKQYNDNIFIAPSRVKNLFSYVKYLNRLMKEREYDIVHIHGNSYTMAIETMIAKKNNIPHRLVHSHNTYTKYKILHNILEKPFKESYTLGLACGKDAGKWLFKEDKFKIIDNGVEVENYTFDLENRMSTRKEFNFSDKDIVIGHVGLFNDQKNHGYFIEFAKHILSKEIQNIKFIFLGEGQNKKNIEQRIKEANLQKYFVFAGNRQDVSRIMSGMDIFLMPSLYEGLPLSLIEAQSNDLPILISDNITPEVMISEYSEIFSLTEDFSSVYNKILNLIRTTNSRLTNETNKYLKKSKYNMENSVNKLNNIYNNLE